MRSRSTLFGLFFGLLAAQSNAAQERYFTIAVNGVRVGYSHEIMSLTPEGHKIVSDSLVKISMMGTEAQQSAQGITLYSPDRKTPLRITIAIRLNDNKPMTIDCRFHNGKVDIMASGVTGDSKQTFPWTSDSYFLAGDTDIECNRLAHALPPGKSACTVKYLDVLTQTVAPTVIRREKPQFLVIGGKKQVCDIYTIEAASGALQFSIDRQTHLVVREARPAQKVDV